MLDTPSRENGRLEGIPRAAIHDLRTPLTSIRGYAQLLLRGVRTPDQAQRAHETIFRESERLARMLDQLSKVAETRLESIELEPKRFDLALLVGHAVEEAGGRWPEHTFAYEASASVEVEADPRRISEALAALLDNAAGFSENGSRIDVLVAVEGDLGRISIRDPGIGIPAEELEGIFDCFQRASNAAKASSGGRGLGVGLFLARAATSEAGGRLWAESEVEVNSTFHLALPLAK